MTEQTVIIDVSGGVASVAECPPGITVIIRDYDNCESGPWQDRPDFCPDESD